MRSLSLLVVLSAAAVSPGPDQTSRGSEAAADAPLADGKQAETGPLLLTISKKTTHIVEPLGEDGYVDYVAALNEYCSQGVTAQTNGAVLFWRAMGPAAVESEFKRLEHREEFFERLNMSPPPREGDYYVPLDAFADALQGEPPRAGATEGAGDWRSVLGGQRDQAMNGPWAQEEFPHLAEWLRVNEEPLRLIVEAAERPRSYNPLIARGEFPAMIAILGPGVPQYREAAWTLTTRAMLRLHTGQLDEAWHDLHACHRLARLVGQGPTVVDGLVATGIERAACLGDALVAQFGNPTAPEAQAFRADLANLPRLVDMAQKFDVAERYTFLDGAATLARKGPDALAKLSAAETEASWLLELFFRSATLTDWDEVLRRGNSAYDRLVEAARLPDPRERRKALFNFVEETRRLWHDSEDIELLKSVTAAGPTESQRSLAARQVGNFLLYVLMPAVLPATIAEERAAVRLQLTDVTLSLAAYRSDHGNHPNRLAQLIPRYIEEIPSDPFGEGEVRYQRRGEGYLLYSLGMNGEDDAGHGWDSEPRGDDIVIRTSPTKQQE